MKGREAGAKCFAAANQVAQIATTMISTGRTVAVRIDGLIVALEGGVSQAQGSPGGEDQTVPTIAGGNHAVKQVDTRRHPVQQIDRSAESHQVAGAIRGQGLVGNLNRHTPLFTRFAQAEPTMCIAIEVEFRCGLGAPSPQGFGDPAMNDRKDGLRFAPPGLL